MRYILLLRGINVGGNTKVSMIEVKEVGMISLRSIRK